MMFLKRCSSCELFKASDLFYDRPDAVDGKHYLCKNCQLKHQKIWRNKNAEKKRQTDRKRRLKLRLQALSIVGRGKIECENCRCIDVRLLEINHIYGGGRKETDYRQGGHRFYRDIRDGKRKIDDLNVLCKVCNSLHYLELKYGHLPFKVEYDQNQVVCSSDTYPLLTKTSGTLLEPELKSAF